MTPEQIAILARWARLTRRKCHEEKDFNAWLIEEWQWDGGWEVTELNAMRHAKEENKK